MLNQALEIPLVSSVASGHTIPPTYIWWVDLEVTSSGHYVVRSLGNGMQYLDYWRGQLHVLPDRAHQYCIIFIFTPMTLPALANLLFTHPKFQ